MASAAWEKTWAAYQAEARRQRTRYERVSASVDERIRDMAESCGFDRDMPLLTANNWYRENPECAERIFALNRRSSRINCERENALSRAWNRLIVPTGAPRSKMTDCKRLYTKNYTRGGPGSRD